MSLSAERESTRHACLKPIATNWNSTAVLRIASKKTRRTRPEAAPKLFLSAETMCSNWASRLLDEDMIDVQLVPTLRRQMLTEVNVHLFKIRTRSLSRSRCAVSGHSSNKKRETHLFSMPSWCHKILLL
ncbi:uncharacterized protein EI90DRAFT_3068811 [Cantharellus anzutake]|uniref:uncharacterized protein n=1 Tax=Cantharellus anzutake TaxID=1750568 RepID=UPI001903AD6E|nr:uncharacterized protein EI90DRAFT_3068811 [Cantharellus anzutake]KAF8327002.1 hypothetical protein EI90DRAFT_3068811 [Cantharellus anzutake]